MKKNILKHRNIKERLPLRREFVYKHRVEFLALDYERRKRINQLGFTTRLNDKEEELVEKMRQEIGYSPTTISYDIFYSSVKLLKKLLICNKAQ